MSISDDLMIRYYELLSDISLKEIEEMKKNMSTGTVNPKDYKVKLANEIVLRFYSRNEADKASKEFENIFKRKELPQDMSQYNVKWINEKMWICHLIKETGLSKSSSEAVRLVKQGAVSIDGEKITDSNLQLKKKENFILKIGRKRFAKIKPV